MSMNGLVRREFRSYLLQFGFLLVTREGDMASLVGGDALFEGNVVEITTAPQYLIQHPLLGRRGTQFFLEGLAYGWLVHTCLFCLIGEKTSMVRNGGSGPYTPLRTLQERRLAAG